MHNVNKIKTNNSKNVTINNNNINSNSNKFSNFISRAFNTSHTFSDKHNSNSKESNKNKQTNSGCTTRKNKNAVNLYFLCTKKGSVVHFMQIQNILKLVNILLYNSYILFITNKNIHILNLNNLYNNLIYQEKVNHFKLNKSYSNVNELTHTINQENVLSKSEKQSNWLVTLSFPDLLRGKTTQIYMTSAGKKNVHFIVISFMLMDQGVYDMSDKMNRNELYGNEEIVRKYNKNYGNDFCYKSVVLYNNACDDEEWNILKYENNNIFIYSKHSLFLYGNKLLILKDVRRREDQCVCVGNYNDDNMGEKQSSEIDNKSKHYLASRKEKRIEEYYLKKTENISLNNKIKFYEINLLKKFKKHILNLYKLDVLNGDDYKEEGILKEKGKNKETVIKSVNNMNKIYSVNNFHYNNTKLVFYHPILLLNYIKMGLFSHVHLSLKLLLHILLNIFYKEKTTYNIKKNCALRFVMENKKLEMTHYNYQDICCSVQKSQFLYDLNFIHGEIYNLYKNKKESLYSSNNLPRDDKNYLTKEKLEQKDQEKENKDKSIYLFENESISLDDFNLNSDSDDDNNDNNKEEAEKKNNKMNNNNNNNNKNKDYDDDDDDDDDNSLLSDDEDKPSELSNPDNNYNNDEKKLKEYLKYSNVINYELSIEEIKMLQILLLHINVPRLNNFFQLILYCMLNAFYYNMDYVCEEAQKYINKENKENSDDDNYNNEIYSDNDHHHNDDNQNDDEEKKGYKICHCEHFNFNLQKEKITYENIHIYEYINNINNNDLVNNINYEDKNLLCINLNKNNLSSCLLFFFRFYINCLMLLNINIDIDYEYVHLFHFISIEDVGKEIYKYAENILTHYTHYFDISVNEDDLFSINLFNKKTYCDNIKNDHIKNDHIKYDNIKRDDIKKDNIKWDNKVKIIPLIKKKKHNINSFCATSPLNNKKDNTYDTLDELSNKKENNNNNSNYYDFEGYIKNNKIIELNNIFLEKIHKSDIILEYVLKYNLFIFFKRLQLFYFMNTKKDLLFIYDILLNRTIKKINTINIEDKEKQNELNECMDFLALLYIAKNEKSKLMLFYKIKKQNKIYDFLSNNFKTERWLKALMNNAYKLMQIKRYYLATAFFILSGDIKDAIDVIHQYLQDAQLSIFLIRLINISYNVSTHENKKNDNINGDKISGDKINGDKINGDK
ncbi:hypothetical protein PFAG_01926 [Plasmodium falciparum Santa Lucia]|nr:hypothetical protein PFAG_01926 [Plasmodium falciparum Santa Lucia]